MAVSQETLDKYWKLQDEAKANIPEFNTAKQGKGIVICAGGKRYFTCAWVCINVLRRLGCTLPIEIWHLGPTEMDDDMRDLVAPLGATCIDAFDVRERHPVRKLAGWELNPYSLIHSSFKEIIFLDADNVALRDPSFLFDTPQYKETGAIFWPDYGRLAADREIWKICRVPYRDECEFESGQIVIDTERCWKELQLTMHLNEHSTDFYYKHIHGDKDTYHMAWHMWGTKYSMPPKGIHALRATMCQHDFEGNRIFQHRNMDKWKLDGGNVRIRGFESEDLCLGFVRDLRTKWDGKIGFPAPKTAAGKELAAEVVRLKYFNYVRVGYDKRKLEFLPDNTIGSGAQGLEKNWYVREKNNKIELCIFGDNHLTCALHKGPKNQFDGKWEQHEQMPIELIPVEGFIDIPSAAGTVPVVAPLPRTPADIPQPPVLGPPVTATPVNLAVPPPAVDIPQMAPEFTPPAGNLRQEDLYNKTFVYVRVGYDSRLMRTGMGTSFIEGSYSLEKSWHFGYEGSDPCITVKDADGDVTFKAVRGLDYVWRGRWTKYEQMDIMLVEVP
jgi:hypothetical protein